MSLTIVIENTTPATRITAAASAVRIGRAASAVLIATSAGHLAAVGGAVDPVRQGEQPDCDHDLDHRNEPRGSRAAPRHHGQAKRDE